MLDKAACSIWMESGKQAQLFKFPFVLHKFNNYKNITISGIKYLINNTYRKRKS